jgi:hypothetical protein
MSKIKETLLNTIQQLTDEEANQTLEFIKHLGEKNATLKRLANDPAFRLPAKTPSFKTVEPIKGKGIPASELLIRDRR